jgi:L-asparagine transporter-like permease
MPGYGKREYMDPTPEPTPEVETVEKRFTMPKMPKVTLVQIVLIALTILYVFFTRKMNNMVVGTVALVVGLLHMYDHLYRVKRGPEHLFFLSKKEKYGCMACK